MLRKLGDWLATISAWSDEAQWRSWLLHAVLAVPIALVFGAWVAVAFYLLRELEQMAHRLMADIRLDWLDHVLDVVAPTVAALVVA